MTSKTELGPEDRENTNELEDVLQEFRVSLSGFDQSRTAALGSYMSVLDYPALERAIASCPEGPWERAAEVWQSDHRSTGSPSFGILAGWVRRILAKRLQRVPD